MENASSPPAEPFPDPSLLASLDNEQLAALLAQLRQSAKPLVLRDGPPQPIGETPLDAGGCDSSKASGTKIQDPLLVTGIDPPRVTWGRRRFKGKATDASRPGTGQRPLTLLDLPIDILKDIFKEVRHTNDLTSLALSHSALHRLAIPHIYSRFDIVWPDTTSDSEPRSGVDALTYGLATLVMAEEIFNRSDSRSQAPPLTNRFNIRGEGRASDTTIRRRRGNHYARFTKKFSLGNGPTGWVEEYLISKEGGKMLGTLVALAIARMRSLETFIWDMPTGILRDVWLSLSSLGDHEDCRLEKIWVRWHDNRASQSSLGVAHDLSLILPSNSPSHVGGNASANVPRINTAALDRVERPNFSVLPPLKSLSVLDIDELSYLDEMAVLIGNSVDKLAELRVGLANHASTKDWTMVWERESLQQVDHDYPAFGSLTIGEKRLGGVLGVLTGHVRDLRKLRSKTAAQSVPKEPENSTTPLVLTSPSLTTPAEEWHDSNSNISDGASSIYFATANDRPSPGSELEVNISVEAQVLSPSPVAFTPISSPVKPEAEVSVRSRKDRSVHAMSLNDARLGKMLRLDNLELERIPLSMPVMQKAIDWTVLTSLTLLHCQNHDQLWKILRRTFAPVLKSPMYPQPRRSSSHHTPKRSARSSNVASEHEYTYSLRLKKIHTNNVSAHTISCIKETLAPNSLEVLFLQDSRTYASPVTIEAIYRGPLRRHRLSLKKLLIDSSEKGSDGLATNSSRWRRWMMTREILGFICGGKMTALREIGVALDYRDWHFFLQNLPCIPHVRSLYIPFLADHVHGTNLDPRELAMQLLDIVSLRPEVELCYMGIANKCFELLENPRDKDDRPGSRQGSVLSGDEGGTGGAGEHVVSEEDDNDEEEDENLHEDVDDEDVEEDDDDENDDDEVDDHENHNNIHDDESIESDHEHDDLNDTDSDSEISGLDGRDTARIRLREILFYDDKVAIFKARHGRL